MVSVQSAVEGEREKVHELLLGRRRSWLVVVVVGSTSGDRSGGEADDDRGRSVDEVYRVWAEGDAREKVESAARSA
jgi:hypothetical protein